MVGMTPGETRNARWAALASIIFHLFIFLLLVALQPHSLIRTGTPLKYVRVGLVEIETANPAQPQTPRKGIATAEKPSKVQPLTREGATNQVQAESKGEEGYNPADYPGDREAGAVLASPIVTPKTIQNFGLSGKVVMKVKISAAGTVESVKITRSSGNDIVDEGAARMARRLPYQPKIFKGKRVPGEVTLTCYLEPEKTLCETSS